jgi:hypothetical protein
MGHMDARFIFRSFRPCPALSPFSFLISFPFLARTRRYRCIRHAMLFDQQQQ